MQTNVSVSNTAITGTLKFIEGGLAETGPLSGEGNFLALKFSNLDSRATSVKVGLNPSQGTGLVEIINDPDRNGVFKITDKDTQAFVVESTDGSQTLTQTFSLAGLVCEDSIG